MDLSNTVMITVENLNYTYPGASDETLFNLNFEIADREIFGFLGPSGAGKSTTQKILIGLLKSYEGRIEAMEKELRDWGQDYYEHIGVSFELPNHYLKLTALENLEYFRSLYAGEALAPEEVLDWVGLSDDVNKKVAEYSKGMKIRLNVARSLIHKPKLLFLDEPTSGLDPANARRIKDLILELRQKGTTIFVTTHDMTVADELCDRIAFITAGQIDVIDSPATLKKQHGERRVLVEYLSEQNDIEQKSFALDGLGENDEFLQLLKIARRIETIHTQESTLEQVFIEVTGQRLVAG